MAESFIVKINRVKEIISSYCEDDGDFWIHGGNELIYEILDTFSQSDWIDLEKDLQNFKDYEHSIFARAIQLYESKRNSNKYDLEKIFFTEFTLLNDLEDAECLLFDMMYVSHITNPELELLINIKEKIKSIRQYSQSDDIESECQVADAYVDKVIEKLYP